MGEALAMVARELTDTIRKNVTIDWTQKEQVRAKLRLLVKRKLRQHGYPPDLAERGRHGHQAGRAAGAGLGGLSCGS